MTAITTFGEEYIFFEVKPIFFVKTRVHSVALLHFRVSEERDKIVNQVNDQ
jgi:hypothetical protein